MNDNIDLIIKKIRNAMYLHRKDMYDYDMLVDFELDHNQWKNLLTYLEQLQSNWNSLREHIDYQLKNNVGSSIDSAIRNHVYQEIKDKMNELEGDE